MGMFGNIAIEGQMRELLKLLDGIAHLPADEQVLLIRRHVEKTLVSAKGGWL